MAASNQAVERINGTLKRVPVLPLYLVALVPGVWTFWQALHGGLGADPMRVLEHELGIWALRFMLATLAVTPLMRWGGVRVLRFRRMLGLTVFFYALAHLAVYLVLDQQFYWGAIARDILKRPYIMFGMAAFVMLLPMAATSNNASVKRLGAAAWRNLHRLAYPAGLFMVLHYLWLVKSWTTEPLIYAAIMAVLLALRLVPLIPGRGTRRVQGARA
ncbi:MAG: protein-methionine-sulfoxide reductase heme-binding subunit MsrQ [Pseudomonadota bacterium]|nr:protein-methionine-sulfoxide reductase heme-binding subunit MsrQ [Pseudomonadota bacterium]